MIDGTGTVSVEAGKMPLVLGVQKSPCRVGKWFRDRFVVAPEKKKVKRRGASLAVCRGNAGCQAWRPLPCRP